MKLELSEEDLAQPTFLLHHRLDRAVRIRMDFQVGRQVANRLGDIASAQFSFSEFFEYARDLLLVLVQLGREHLRSQENPGMQTDSPST